MEKPNATERMAEIAIDTVKDLQSEVSRLEGLNRELVDALTWSESLFRVLLNGSIAFTDTEKFNIHAITALLSRASSKEETKNKEA